MKEGRVGVFRVIFVVFLGRGSSRVGHRPPKNLLLSFPLLPTQACMQGGGGGVLLSFTILLIWYICV